MKKVISVICAVLMLASVLGLAACGNSTGGGQDISGSYKLIEMTVGGEDMTSYLSLIGDVMLTIEGDKATMEMGEETTELTVDTSAQTMSDGEGSATPYTFDGNKLTLEDTSSDTKMVFERK